MSREGQKPLKLLRRRLFAGLVAAGLIGSILVATAPASRASTLAASDAGATPQASIAPDTDIGNEQVVTVNWSGFTPTAPDPNSSTVRYADVVGVYECVAPDRLPDGNYYFTRDCYTQLPPNYPIEPGDGNMVDPLLNSSGLWGVTGPSGTGQIGFQVQEGTLHSNQRFMDGTEAVPSFNIQCDQSDPCVLKVIDFGKFFDKYSPYPNFPGDRLKKGDWTELADAAPSVPISFGSSTVCPPPASTTPQVSVEGAGSASYAIEAWAGQLCRATSPIAVDSTTTGEVVARSAFESGSTDVALAALPPSSGPNGGSYAAAPLDVSGAAIAFRISDQVKGTPVTTVRLTPRLVAMLVTDSATDGNPTYADSADIYPLTADPEFQALNPGVTFPGGFGDLAVIEPLLEGSGADDTEIITQWIADDADARAFLAGDDVCGAKLNSNWAGISYPTTIFRDLEQNPAQPSWGGYYNPLTNLLQEVDDLFYGVPAGFNPEGPGGTAAASMPPVVDTEAAMFAELDYTSATRAAEPAASLSAASSTSTIGDYVTETSPGHCAPKTLSSFPAFTAPSPQSLALGVGAMSHNPDGTLKPPVATSVAGAYPLTKVDYAFVPTSNLSETEAGALAQFIRYVAGPGQSTGVLPYGYSPLPSSLTAQDAVAATAALNGVATAGQTSSVTPEGTTIPTSIVASTAQASTGTSAGATATGPATPPGSQLLNGNGSSGPGGVVKQFEGPVTIAALVRTAWWLLPLILGLALALGLAGAVLGWEFPLPRRRSKPS